MEHNEEYVKQLEANNEKMSEALAKSLTTINKWLEVTCHETDKKITICLLVKINSVKSKSALAFEPLDPEGSSINKFLLCEAFKAKMIEGEKEIRECYHLEFCSNETGVAELSNTAMDITAIVMRKFDLLEVPISYSESKTEFTRAKEDREHILQRGLFPPLINYSKP